MRTSSAITLRTGPWHGKQSDTQATNGEGRGVSVSVLIPLAMSGSLLAGSTKTDAPEVTRGELVVEATPVPLQQLCRRNRCRGGRGASCSCR